MSRAWREPWARAPARGIGIRIVPTLGGETPTCVRRRGRPSAELAAGGRASVADHSQRSVKGFEPASSHLFVGIRPYPRARGRRFRAAGPAPECRSPRALVNRRFAPLRSACYSISAAQLRHPTNRRGEGPCPLQLDRHAPTPYRWSCAAQRVTFLSSCARRSDTPRRFRA